MKFFIVLALVAAVAVAAPVDPKDATIVNQEFDNIGTDGFRYGYSSSDGNSASAEGALENVGTDAEELVVRGQFQYTAPNGELITVTYTADKNGFRAEGAHLPA